MLAHSPCTLLSELTVALYQILLYDFSLAAGNTPLAGCILKSTDALERISINPESKDDEINEVGAHLFLYPEGLPSL